MGLAGESASRPVEDGTTGASLEPGTGDIRSQFDAMQGLLERQIAALREGRDPGQDGLLAGYSIENPYVTRSYLEHVYAANRAAALLIDSQR